ncbi:MAG: HAD-IA family hydrolase [Bacteroidales bacterium]|nr:HAD-IA family hydrolase [Bacteroidales bacterium]
MEFNKQIKAVIFDLDGTLVHTIEDIGDAANTLFRKHGYPEHTTATFVKWIGNGATRFIEQGIGGGIDPAALADYVKEFKDLYRKNYAVKSSLFDGIESLLDLLAEEDIKLSVLSNKPHHLTVKVVEHYLGKWKIEPVLGQRDEVPRKPDPAAALEIAGMLGIDPGQVLFVGDSIGDINTAVAAGMIPIGVSWGYGKLVEAKEQGYKLIKTPVELLEYMNYLND